MIPTTDKDKEKCAQKSCLISSAEQMCQSVDPATVWLNVYDMV